MRRRSLLGIAAAIAILASSVLAGCGKQAATSDGGSLDQQRKDVMGAPAPAAEQAKIAAWQAQQQQKMQNAQQGAPAGHK